MSLTQLSQHRFIPGGENPAQCFQRYGQPLSQLCYALVETDPDGVQFVRWSKIQQLYDREGKVKFVVDGNDHVPLAVGPDMQIIVPWRIQAFLHKTLQVALNDEQPGCLDPKTPADVHPIATTDENVESGPSSFRQSKPSNAGSFSSPSSSSSEFMTTDTKQYTATTSSSSLALPPPVATAAMSRSMTAVFSDDAGPSTFTWPTIAATKATSFSLHTPLEVAQCKNAVPILPLPTCPQELAQGKADHTLGDLGRSPPHTSLSLPCCLRCHHQTCVDSPRENFIQMFTPSTPTPPVPWLHEPTLPVICMDCSFSFQHAPIYSAPRQRAPLMTTVTSRALSTTTHPHLRIWFHSPLWLVSSRRHASTYPIMSGLEAHVNQSLLSTSQVAENYARPSFPQPTSRRSASMQALSTRDKKLMKNRLSSLTMDCNHFSIDLV